jgi:uncharacterized repeat protein (TIGR01451 family)
LIYGTTDIGGKAGDGTVFAMTAAGKITTLHSFGDGSVPHDGVNPVAGLVMGLDGNLYGTTMGGGTAGMGTVFRITPDGKETILHSFGSSTNDGTSPCGVLTLGMDGNLYGSTSWGGVDNAGSIFKVVIHAPPALSLSLGASVQSIAAGNNIVYTIDCTNRGAVAAYDVQLTGDLPAHTTLVSQGSTGNTWTQVGTQISCEIGSLSPGKKVSATLTLNVDPSAAPDSKVVNSLEGNFDSGTIPHSPNSIVTVLGHESKGLGFSVRNDAPDLLLGVGAGSSPKSPISGKLQLASKLTSLWMNFDVSNNGSKATWKPSSDSSQGMAMLQVVPPGNSSVDLTGSFSELGDSLTVSASPFAGGLGYAGTLNELQLIGLLPAVDKGSNLSGIAQIVPQFASLPDFASAAGAFNQALSDYTNTNWSGLNGDLQTMSASLTALANNSSEFAQFATDVLNLNPAANVGSIKAQIVQAAGLDALALMFTSSPAVMFDILQYNLSAPVNSTFYALPN